jgi:hypothetical protein
MKILAGLIKSLSLLAMIAILSTTNSQAENIVLDFEGVGDLAPVSDFYNSATDGASNLGINKGVHFSNDAYGIIDLDVNMDLFHGNFANEPSASTVLIFREGGSATMNVETGFDSSFSVFYSSSRPSTIKIFDGLDGTGNQLASMTLVANHKNQNCTPDIFGDFCHWDSVGATFKGIAKSVVFDGPREYTYYDNIAFGKSALKKCKDVELNSNRLRFSDGDNSIGCTSLNENKAQKRNQRNRKNYKLTVNFSGL